MALLCTDDYPSFAICSEDGALIAYLSAAKALDELQIINVAVREDYRSLGLGGQLMSAAEEFCRENALASISLEVRESNERAISLYTHCGFFCAGVRKNFYRKPTENAVIMIKNLT